MGQNDSATRNPILLLRLSGLFLLRYAQRALSWLLFHDPPRSASPCGPPPHQGRLALRCRTGNLFLPSAQEPPDLVHQARGVLVTAPFQQVEVNRQTQAQAQLGQLDVSLAQRNRLSCGIGRFGSLDERALQVERAGLDAAGERKAMLARELERARHEPRQEIVDFDKDRGIRQRSPPVGARLAPASRDWHGLK
jgi:hypothetical protein